MKLVLELQLGLHAVFKNISVNFFPRSRESNLLDGEVELMVEKNMRKHAKNFERIKCFSYSYS